MTIHEIKSAHSGADSREAVLSVRELTTQFSSNGTAINAVDGISFEINAGETLGLVGESGSGKSVTALSIAQLLPASSARSSGSVRLDGMELIGLPERQMRELRGRSIGFIFQDPMTSLNPVLSISEQIAEPARTHFGLSRRAGRAHAVELLDAVGIPFPERRADEFPHQLSGGMRQRVMIAIALSCKPKLLIADEPTTALDVTTQEQILTLIATLSAEVGAATILITHDMGVAARMCDTINVMYSGHIVEAGPVETIFASPRMPYTQGLLRSVPALGSIRDKRLFMISGSPPKMGATANGCRFEPRCIHARQVCRESTPDLTPRETGSLARCWGTDIDGWIK